MLCEYLDSKASKLKGVFFVHTILKSGVQLISVMFILIWKNSGAWCKLNTGRGNLMTT